MKRAFWLWLLVFVALVVLVGCSDRSTDKKQPDTAQRVESVKAVEAVSENPKEVPAKKEEKTEPINNAALEREKFIEEIRLNLVERGLIDDDTPIYTLRERIDMSGRDDVLNPVYGTVAASFEGYEYYVDVPRILKEGWFAIGIDVVGGKDRLDKDRNRAFGILVDDEIVPFSSSFSLVGIVVDRKKATRYNFTGSDRRIVEKFEEPSEAVLFFTIAGKTDVIILLAEDIMERR